ncbi:MAG: DMP19 family protein [Gammaproteobacteria bacterium]|nr:DMP19 family protein [Gammaproteobacteria bacterium]MBU1504560.1 DMP19 family protein [Gammaproteobacteria bacterium]MBU2119422.1 DMP19 family protein [Gammaproteobacteria bacterium]MBU2202811.1 DMP19 family protein [Gammaproteobacteria bacterium]MBU2272550.1 DMP19 family protein [Gammaproteobacteria bacterium]
MIQRLPCKSCGDSIHPDTAAKNDGLCMPCKGGYRQRIEDGKKRREQERLYEKSPERLYWKALVDRVHGQGGFDTLGEAEKTYYAVSCLVGEVYNGGFHQFFWNHSGSLYGHALSGLMDMEATQSLQLTMRAKELLFGDLPVPVDVQTRRDLLPEIEGLDAALDSVDKPFWKDPDKLGERCEAFARTHGLY